MKLLPFHGVMLLEKSEKLFCIDGTVHVALCAMAAEAFLQDIKSYYKAISTLRFYTPPRTLFNLDPEPKRYGGGALINGKMELLELSERELGGLIDRLEKEPLIAKYEGVIKYLNDAWVKGADESFKNLKRLIGLRNKLVHIKSDEIQLDDNGEVSEHPRVIYELLRMKVLEGHRSTDSWIYMLDSESLVRWARRTVIDVMSCVLEILPDAPVSISFKSSYLASVRSFGFE